MASEEAYIGQRRSYTGALCTVRYVGPLSNTKGEWLGVEWDDASRGKHNGQHEGQQVFQCVSSAPTAASFLRPFRKPDPEKTLVDAIKCKYAPAAGAGGNAADGMIEISGKVVEEVGFERIQEQLSILANLKIVLVDELVVSGITRRHAPEQDKFNAQAELAQTCPNIVELDLGWNIIETWQDVADACFPLKKLKILKAGRLRLREFEARRVDGHPFYNVEELHLNECLIRPTQILQILSPGGVCQLSSLQTLSLLSNELESFKEVGEVTGRGCSSTTTVILDNNRLTDLSSLPTLFSLFPNLAALSLQGNAVSSLGLDSSISFPKLETLNLAANRIQDYSFIDSFPTLFPNLTSLRISRNPLYDQPKSQDDANDRQRQPQPHAPSTASDSTSYYLTLARIPGLKSLNYTTIAPRDREEGEIYYLSVAEKEIKSILDNKDSSEDEAQIILARQRHPLYQSLCAKYDRDDILQHYQQDRSAPTHDASSPFVEKSPLDRYAPGTLGSRLVDARFYIPSSSHSIATSKHPPLRLQHSLLLPTTISVYRLKSLLAQHLGLPALGFKLVYESHEYDPVEPISSTRNRDATTSTAGRAGAGQDDVSAAWAGWGDWDVDGPDKYSEVDDGFGEHGPGPEPGSHAATTTTTTAFPHPGSSSNDTDLAPMYVTREGHRFKKRETEILDGMRPWGDFLDVDDPAALGRGRDARRRRHVRVRVEPHESTGGVMR